MVKLGIVLSRVPSIKELASDAFLGGLHRHLPSKGKTVFGVSVYGPHELQRYGRALAKRIKTFLTENGRPARFILGERGVLSSVVVTKERMTERGIELLIVDDGREIVAAKTIAVQAFEEFSHRDYGRPGRNATSGMLPPKLARIIVNLAAVDRRSVLLDPFCGSGTILNEALVLGCGTIYGTDLTDRAVRESRENAAWLARQAEKNADHVHIQKSDVVDLGKHLRPASVDAIVTEPTLGPPQRGTEDLEAIRQEFGKLYERAFRVFARLARPGARVVFMLPVFFGPTGPRFFKEINRFFGREFRQLPLLPQHLMAVHASRLSFRGTIVYHRPGQRVGREILVATRSSG